MIDMVLLTIAFTFFIELILPLLILRSIICIVFELVFDTIERRRNNEATIKTVEASAHE